jgi:glucan phosphoethanolaminetransferase (alkaline phosphatase superfamily)
MSSRGPFGEFLQPPARALAVLAAVWALSAACALELYAWAYELSSPDIVARLGVLAAVVGCVLLGHRRLAQGKPVGWPGAVAALVVGALALRLFAVNLLHAMLVLGLLTAGLAGAWILARVPGPDGLRRALVAALLGTLHFVLFGYYALLFIGRETWQEVVSLELIIAYLPQVPDLVAVLPVSAWVLCGGVAAAYLAVLATYHAFSRPLCEGLRSIGGGRARFAVTAVLASVVCAMSSPVAGDWLYRSFLTDYRDPLATTLLVKPTPFEAGDELRLVRDPVKLARERQVAASYAAPERAPTKTLVLITVDALRADQMGVYGHPRDNTPFLARLHHEGRLVRVDNAFSTCAVSFCGLVGIHTSKYWHEVAERNFTLVDALKRLGYRSHFLLGGDHSSHYGLGQFIGAGVDDYRDGRQAHRYVNDDEQVLDWVDGLPARDGTARFLYVHLMSAHILGLRHPQYKRWQAATPSVLDLRRAEVSAEVYANHYHDGILQADGMIERIFGHLREKGWLDDAIVIITADHGELLGEDGRFGHGKSLRDPVVRVPLLVHDTGGHVYPARALASTVDIAPTFLDRIGAPIPAHWAGESLARPEAQRFVFLHGAQGPAAIGRFDGELFKHYHYRKTAAEELFNLSQDPREERPLPQAARAEIAAAMRAALAPLVAVDPKRVRR